MHSQFGILMTRLLLVVALFVIAVLIIADTHDLEENGVEGQGTPPNEVTDTPSIDGEATPSPEEPTIDPVSVERGALIAADQCVACHGVDGNANIPTNGNLAGQNERYLYRQLLMIQSKAREIPTMNISLEGIDDDGLLSLAMYYASLPGRIGQANPDQDIALGESIYRGGILEKEVAACTSCHAPNGNGNFLAGFPRVSGQTVQYLEAQLKAYREDERTTDEDYGGMMRDIARKLTDGEISAVANYMTGLY